MDLFVEKDTDLMRSTFVAIGMAALFESLPLHSKVDVRILDLGSVYQIQVPYEPHEAQSMLQERGGDFPVLIPAIRKAFSEKEKQEIATDPDSAIKYKYVPQGFHSTDIVEYEQEQQLAHMHGEQTRGKRPVNHTVEVSPDYPLWAHLCSYFNKGAAMRVAYPTLLHTWHAHSGVIAGAVLSKLISTYSQVPNTPEILRNWWIDAIYPDLCDYPFEIRADIGTIAIVSPSTSRGSCSKTAAIPMVEETGKEFWLIMYLAYAGFMIAAMPFKLENDTLTVYPLPHDLALRSLRKTIALYRQASETKRLYDFSSMLVRSKLESLAILGFYKSNAEHNQTTSGKVSSDAFAQHYSGLSIYYYKHVGGGQIAFDETHFPFPVWLAGGDTVESVALLQQQYEIIIHLRGKSPQYVLSSNEVVVLRSYREFLASGSARDWITFTIRYNFYRFSRMGEQYIPMMSVELFEETLVAIQPTMTHYQTILNNSGFRAIADAIRGCTINTRLLEIVKGGRPMLRTRPGLGKDLLRSASHSTSGRFITHLANFLQEYSRQISQIQTTQTTQDYQAVTERHLLDMISLIDSYGAQLVADLLVAVGYSSVHRKTAEQK